jgi:hypothetical protein
MCCVAVVPRVFARPSGEQEIKTDLPAACTLLASFGVHKLLSSKSITQRTGRAWPCTLQPCASITGAYAPACATQTPQRHQTRSRWGR